MKVLIRIPEFALFRSEQVYKKTPLIGYKHFLYFFSTCGFS